jgi:hypothetical protein
MISPFPTIHNSANTAFGISADSTRLHCTLGPFALPRHLWPPQNPNTDLIVPLKLPQPIYRGNCAECLQAMAQAQLNSANAPPTKPLTPPSPATTTPPTTSTTTAATVSVKPKQQPNKRPRKSVPLMITNRPAQHHGQHHAPPGPPHCNNNPGIFNFPPVPSGPPPPPIPPSTLDPTLPQFIPQTSTATVYPVPPPVSQPPPVTAQPLPLSQDLSFLFPNLQPVPLQEQVLQECSLAAAPAKTVPSKPDQPFPVLQSQHSSYAIDFNFRGHHFRINSRPDAVWGSVATEAATHIGLPLHCVEFVKYVRPLKVALYLRPVHELGLFNHDQSISRTIDVRIRKEIPPYVNP